MEVGMIHGLAGITPHVEDETVPALRNPFVGSHRMGGPEKMAEQAVLGDLAGVGQVLARHHQHVDRRPRGDVLEGDHLVVLEEHPRRRSTGGYLAEDAICHSSSERTRPT
jgi:hypothetical protein